MDTHSTEQWREHLEASFHFQIHSYSIYTYRIKRKKQKQKNSHTKKKTFLPFPAIRFICYNILKSVVQAIFLVARSDNKKQVFAFSIQITPTWTRLRCNNIGITWLPSQSIINIKKKKKIR